MTGPDEVLGLWNAAMPFPLDGTALGSRPLWEADTRLVREHGRAVGLVSVAGPGRPWQEDRTGHLRVIAVHPEHRGRGLGSDLLAWAEATLRGRGATRIVVGGEPHHYFPGLPLEATEATAFLGRRGYDLLDRVSNDLARELGDLPPLQLPDGARVEAAVPEGILEFVSAEFPGRWPYDVGSTLERAPHQALALTVGGTVVGFALVGLRTDPVVLPSCLWSEDCGLGPMGVSGSLRGQGLGRALLVGAMHHLKARGGTHMGVDWTGVQGFYQNVGFEIVRRYRHAARDLEPV